MEDPIYSNIRRVHPQEDKRTLIENVKVTAADAPTYPSTWFKDHPNSKPPIVVDASYATNFKALAHTVHIGFKDNKTLTSEIVVAFVFSAFAARPMKLVEDWKSFGVLIGKAEADCYLSDLTDMKTEDKKLALAESTREYSEDEIAALILAVCGIYRLHVSTLVSEYSTTLGSKISKLIGNINADIKFGSTHTRYAGWLLNPNYIRMCAFVDMYLVEFPKHVYSRARTGTIGTRYKDCNALLSLTYTMESLRLSLPRLAVWIWVSTAWEEFTRLTKKGEEMDEKRSYALYFMELHLSPKSPYSSSLNSTLHCLFHLIGSARSLKRSINARYVGNPDLMACIANATVIAYVNGTFTDLGVGFAPNGFEVKAAGPTPKKSAEKRKKEKEPEEPKTLDSVRWMIYMARNKFVIPEKMRIHVCHAWAAINDPRKETIGEKAKLNAKVYLKAQREMKDGTIAMSKKIVPGESNYGSEDED